MSKIKENKKVNKKVKKEEIDNEDKIENKKRKNYKLRVFLLGLYLFAFSVIIIIICGQSFNIKYEEIKDIGNINDIDVVIKNDDPNSDKEIIKCVDKYIDDDGLICTKYRSVNKGIAIVEIKNRYTNEIYKSDYFYVHDFGVISFDNILGQIAGSKIIPISLIIWLIYICYVLIKALKNSAKKNLYQYRNIVYFAFILYIGYAIVSQISVIFSGSYYGIYQTVLDFMDISVALSLIALPIAFVTSIFITISNIVLIKKEGFSFINVLGVITGLAFCLLTLVPEIIEKIIILIPGINLSDSTGIALYIKILFEEIVYACVAYFECVLLGTIIMGIISAKHVPKFDKDYILILGCQIRKDGTLTNLLKARVDRAIEFANMQKEATGKDIIFVPSGGKGNDEVIAEAEAMKNYLIVNGIKEKNILVENKSKNTFENIGFSNKLIKEKNENAVIAFSTTNYHVLRAGSIATDQNIYIEGIGAKTKTYFWINAFIREYIATLYSEKKRHFLMIGAIIIAMNIMVLLFYLANVL